MVYTNDYTNEELRLILINKFKEIAEMSEKTKSLDRSIARIQDDIDDIQAALDNRVD